MGFRGPIVLALGTLVGREVQVLAQRPRGDLARQQRRPAAAAVWPWGPAARRFFDGCLATANDARDVDFYHWSSQSFGEFWKDALSVLMARERARIGLAASEGDLSRRIVAYAYDDQEDSAAYT